MRACAFVLIVENGMPVNVAYMMQRPEGDNMESRYDEMVGTEFQPARLYALY